VSLLLDVFIELLDLACQRLPQNASGAFVGIVFKPNDQFEES
jgi:hypothetical protein